MTEKKNPQEIPGRTMLKKNITPERALAEFRVAAEIWLGYMDARHKAWALALIEAKVKAAEKIEHATLQ